jgi:hypothetical protein
LGSLADDSTFASTLGMLNGFSYKYKSSIVRGTFDSSLLSLGIFFTEVEEDFFLVADFFFFDFSFLTSGATEKVRSGNTVDTGSTLNGMVGVLA